MALPDGVFFDEKEMLAMGWPFGVVQMLRRVFEADAINLQTEIDANSDDIVELQEDKANKIDPAVVSNIVTQLSDGDIQDSGVAVSQISTNTTDIGTNKTDISNLQTDKANKISPAVLDNIVTQLSDGDIQDSGVAVSQIGTNTTDISNLQTDKADKISSPTLDNLVSQDATGNIKDSGIASSVIGDKANKISSPTTGNLISQTAGGDIQDAGVDISDLVTLSGTGNPEGIVTANNSRFFVDTAVPQLYFNPTVGATTGWVAL